MTSTFSSRRLRRFLPQLGTQLAKLQEELETQLREATANNGDGDGENGEDTLDIGDGIDGGDTGSSAGDEEGEREETENNRGEDPEDEEGAEEEVVEEDDPIVGNGFVEEVAEELEGSRTSL
jgi:hypothetical protein